jgi:glycosyltransferase involved in cell wall biosynthesis
MKIGLIARADNTGLGNQSRELAYMLKPDRILVIDSTFFMKNEQHFDWYDGFNHKILQRFPNSFDAREFLAGLDVVITAETFYNSQFIVEARKMRVKTFLQYNYEFLEYLLEPFNPMVDVLVAPSLWNYDKVEALRKHKLIHLPPPTDGSQFNNIRKNNLKQTNKLLHIVGKPAVHDRNGTLSIIKAMDYVNKNISLVIKSQYEIEELENIENKNITIDYNHYENAIDLYDGYDAMILPRRYAGLCLPMNEALMAGLPVIMTDISPNNTILPNKWLAKSEKIGEFKARAMIDIFEANPEDLADKINKLYEKDISDEKVEAYEIGYNNFSYGVLYQKYIEAFENA